MRAYPGKSSHKIILPLLAERGEGRGESRNQLSARCIRWSKRASCFRESSCCQMRKTVQPSRRSVRFTIRSRALLRANFFRQNARLVAGLVACSGQPCQKQPSTKTASLNFGKTKSGLPKIFGCRRQPVILCRRNNFTSASSVFLFPCPRIRASPPNASLW